MPLLDKRPEVVLDRVFFATDFSTASQKALGYAVAIARRHCAELDVVHVVDLSAAMVSSEGPTECLLEALLQSSRESLNASVKAMRGVKMRVEVREGISPPDDLLACSREFSADLIVMGTASKHGLDKLILGSTAERVLRAASCPVLVVGPHAAEAPSGALALQQIVCADDFGRASNRALEFALSFAQDDGAHLYVCHVLAERGCDPVPLHDADLQKRMEELIGPESRQWCTAQCVVEHGHAVEQILAVAARVNADLIVLGPRSGSFWLDNVHTGTTPAILARAGCPVLTVR